MTEPFKFDISGWLKKSLAVQRTAPAAAESALDKLTDQVMTKMIANLTGPSYGVGGRGPQTGQMPIPRQTGNLADSGGRNKITPFLNIVFSDVRKANYNKHVHNGTRYVHNGTRYVQPRRFLGDVITELSKTGILQMERNILNSIRQVGR